MGSVQGAGGDRPVRGAGQEASDDLERLTRWEAAGGAWWTVAVSGGGVTVVLARCDGGEEVDRFSSDDPRLVAYVDTAP
ncbi:UNVERIFIED_CONTAM: hypothetical protein LK11_38155 [Mumia flava]